MVTSHPRPDVDGFVDHQLTRSPDPDRTIVRFFVPGQEDVGPGDSRAAPVIERILALSEQEVTATLGRILARFESRHPGIIGDFDEHADLVGLRLDHAVVLSVDRRRLLGAVFTHEYAIEGAALCNPSIVRHPDQRHQGDTEFVLSVRGIGEGHRSSIGFRTGRVTADGTVSLDAPGPHPRTGTHLPGVLYRSVLHRKLAELGDDHENAAFVLDLLPERFDRVQLDTRLAALAADAGTRRNTAVTIANLQHLAGSSYRMEFTGAHGLSERVLWPQCEAERHGMEDARFVEITDGSAPRYCATYTAFDGTNIAQHLLTTEDFCTFHASAMGGRAALGKGLALFPRRIDGCFVALSRSDRETNSIAYSDDLHTWDTAHTIQTPQHPWEVVQLGNCGSPVETPDGWLVITHGVGAMRTYSLGAILLDLDDPHRVIGTTTTPLITPPRHAGYVPNVVYSCGAMAVDGRLILPYAVGDQTIAVATIELDRLIASMRDRS